MGSSSLEKLRARMALVAYFRDAFGVSDPNDADAVKQFYKTVNRLNEGYNAEGRSYVYQFVASQVDEDVVSNEDLIRYDKNLKHHTEAINDRRTDPIVWKPFQLLAGLMTEAYLDKVTDDSEAFLDELNEFVEQQNDGPKGRIKFPEFEEEDLNKVAFWMATGSGKTLVMHLNYYQYLHYAERSDDEAVPDNILLVTPNEGLSQQHLDALRRSSIPCHHFNDETTDLTSFGRNPVKVIEIQKLVDEKSGEGKSIEVDAFGNQNLVFVDEGHKGAGSDAQTWKRRRDSLASNGFTFEYSATFGQALSNASSSVEEEYGRAILFDYSYPRFYDDGYGKDYEVLNFDNEIASDLRDQYLLANLLTYYEQVHVFNSNVETFLNTYNIRPPLLVFIGHTVNATTSSDLGKNDEETFSDVEEVLEFISRVLLNDGDWVPESISAILDGRSGLVREDGRDFFEDSFEALRDADLSGQEIYEDLIDRAFHVDQSSTLDLVGIENADGEIGLRATSTDEYFGVINIGGDAVFLDRLEGKFEQINVEKEQFQGSLFRAINERDSSVNMLLGSRKFIEGWDSWRVSTMGLMNFGRGEGSQVIQLFGRGVRLQGKNFSLKRTSATDSAETHPENIEVLETLNIFGVRADYMANFRDYLSEEGIDTDPREVLEIPTEPQEHFQNRGLFVVRPDIDAQFTDRVNFELTVTDEIHPEVDLRPQVARMASRGDELQEDRHKVARRINPDVLPLLDWDEIYRQLWQFRKANEYTNLVAERETLRAILEQEDTYTLYCNEDLIRFTGMESLDDIQEVAVMVLRRYVEAFYAAREQQWEHGHLTYVSMDDELAREQGNFIENYTVEVKKSADSFLDELRAALDSDDLFENESGAPNRIHYDRHLYLPLIAEESAHADEVTYKPEGLNEGEIRFVKQLKEYFEDGDGADLLETWDVFLLRNQTRGRGIGLLSGTQRFFPDFIMWFQSDDHQHIVFLEPHGMAKEGDPVSNHRVEFHDEVAEYENALTDRSGKDHISLHSYVISQTEYSYLKTMASITDRDEFHDCGIYFPDDGVGPLIEDFLSNSTA